MAKKKPDAAPPTEVCGQCGGETYIVDLTRVDLTRCRGCNNEFYTAEQSRAASPPGRPLPELLREWLQVWYLHGGKTDYYAGGLVRNTNDALDYLKRETDG